MYNKNKLESVLKMNKKIVDENKMLRKAVKETTKSIENMLSIVSNKSPKKSRQF
jgi:hypothetical protein